MDFTLTVEQQMVRDTARALFAKECPSSLVRAHIVDPAAADVLWPHLQDWVALGDGPCTDLALFCEEAGAAIVPGPFFVTAALALPLLRAMADAAPGSPTAAIADQVGAGTRTATVAWAGVDGIWVIDPPEDHGRTFILEADRVDTIVVMLPGPSAIAVDARILREELVPVATLDTTRRCCFLSASSVASLAGATAVVPLDPDRLAGVLAGATVALAAELVGTARWLLDASVAYAKERVQFDKPIGAFQAVQHQLVDMALDVERATAAVFYAAMAVDAADEDAPRATHVAKAAAGTAARHCAKVGMQIHGGIGYTWEHDLHLYLRRAHASDDLLGDAAYHHDRLAALLFG